ncbi:MAG: YncE family protein, partial [Gemmatimonadales bacterium]|nr:YncE family protein [Gemmatimonadales bacterium]
MPQSPRLVSAAVALSILIAATTTAAAQSGTLVVVNKAASTASVIDVSSGRTLATLPTGNGPHEVAITRDGRIAVVTDYGDRRGNNTLTVIDVPGLRVARTIDLGQYRRPHGIAFLPGDSLVAVTSEEAQAVVVVRVADGSIVKTLPTGQGGSHMLAVTGDGATIYTGNIRDGTVSQLDVVTGTRTRLFQTPPQPEAITVTADGREVWVGSNSQGKVSVVDVATGKVDEALDGFSFPYRILITPDNRHVLIPDFRAHELRIVDRATRAVVDLMPLDGAGPQGITLSPDGTTVYHALSLENRIAIIDLASRSVVRHLDAGA